MRTTRPFPSFFSCIFFLVLSTLSLSCVAANEQGSLHLAKLCSGCLLLFAPGPTSRRRPPELQGNSHGAMIALISHADHLRGIFSDEIRRGPTIPVYPPASPSHQPHHFHHPLCARVPKAFRV